MRLVSCMHLFLNHRSQCMSFSRSIVVLLMLLSLATVLGERGAANSVEHDFVFLDCVESSMLCSLSLV